MIVGVVLTAAGLVDAAGLVGQPFAVAAVTYLVAAVLSVAVMVARSTVDIAVADRVAAGQDDLAGSELWSAATAGWFRVHLLLAYAAVTVAGVALLRDSSVPGWAGWTAVSLGLVAGIGNATGQPRTKAWGPLFEPPFVVHIPTLVIGISLLMACPRANRRTAGPTRRTGLVRADALPNIRSGTGDGAAEGLLGGRCSGLVRSRSRV